MATTLSQLYQATPSITLEEQANLARLLISANEHYTHSNDAQYDFNKRQQHLSEAAKLCQRVHAALPDDLSALNLMGRIHLDQQKESLAYELFQRALTLAPQHANSLINMGYYYLSVHTYDKAEGCFISALANDKHSQRAFSGIALAKLKQRDYLAAFNHFRRLFELGLRDETLVAHFLSSLESLHCDQYEQALEQLLLSLFCQPNADYRKLSLLSSSLLCAKYKLDDEHTILDLDTLIKDQLLLELMSKAQVKSIQLESLLADLRNSILNEVMQTSVLRDELQAFCIALGIYSANNDYILMCSHQEERDVALLIGQIKQRLSGSWQQADVIGALMVVGLYEPLYQQSFSTALLRHAIEDWPLALQTLLNRNLYEPCELHGKLLSHFGQTTDDLLGNELHGCLNRWQTISPASPNNLHHALSTSLGEHNVPAHFKSARLTILLIGCGSGERAFYLAKYFDKVKIHAIDNSKENLSFAIDKAKQLNISNISFGFSELDAAPSLDEQYDLIEFSAAINHTLQPETAMKSWSKLLKPEGLIRFDFSAKLDHDSRSLVTQLVQERKLSPTVDNIRHLRHAIMQEANSGLWDELFLDEYFYTGAGCKELFFQAHNHHFDIEKINTLLKNTQLKFKGFANTGLEYIKARAQHSGQSISEWHQNNGPLFQQGNHYQLYCSR